MDVLGGVKLVRSEIRELSSSSVGNVHRILVKVRERENVNEHVCVCVWGGGIQLIGSMLR